ncbi:hypothetical protein N7475_007430 [Penicillium sp. IBT 31633x]|nr:hypothetical protein N7475_007430 [Penicillium sp. IBT 31633x]
MDPKQSSSYDSFAVKTSDSISNNTNVLPHSDASQPSFPNPNTGSKGGSYMLEAWANADPSSDPWSSAKILYLSKP